MGKEFEYEVVVKDHIEQIVKEELKVFGIYLRDVLSKEFRRSVDLQGHFTYTVKFGSLMDIEEEEDGTG